MRCDGENVGRARAPLCALPSPLSDLLLVISGLPLPGPGNLQSFGALHRIWEDPQRPLLPQVAGQLQPRHGHGSIMVLQVPVLGSPLWELFIPALALTSLILGLGA